MAKRLLLFVMLVQGCLLAKAQSDSDKNFINQVGMELLDQWDADAYGNALSLLDQVAYYDTKAISQWLTDALGGLKTANTSSSGGTSDSYRLMLCASKLTGHFKVVAGRWVYEGDANDLQFAFPDQEGLPCVARVSTSGRTKTISVPYEKEDDDFYDDDDYYDDYYGYDDEGGLFDFHFKGIKNLMSDVNMVSIEVPEHLEISFTQGGKQVMLTNIDFDLNSFAQDWESLLDGFIVSVHSSFAKSDGTGTFEMGMDRVGYQPGTGINISYYAKNDGNQLLSFRFNAPGTINLDEGLFNKGTDMINDIGIESLNMDLDIMGRLQVHNAIPDLLDFFSVLSGVEDIEDEDEGLLLQNELNGMIDSKFYYDNSSSPKGSFGLKLVYDEDFEEWTMEPTINFVSNNSTCPVTAFFTDDIFSDFMGNMQSIVNDMMGTASIVKQTIERIDDEVTDIRRLKATEISGAGTEFFTIDGRAVSSSSVLPRGSIYITRTPAGSRKFIKK